jgi:predicted nucleic acid-binding protein
MGSFFGQMNWVPSNRVVTDYEEIIKGKAGRKAWTQVASFIELTAVSGHLIQVSPHFQFHIVGGDPDDNAFTGCAIAAHADCVFTDGHHFAPLEGSGLQTATDHAPGVH